jgi:hypothetical protein
MEEPGAESIQLKGGAHFINSKHRDRRSALTAAELPRTARPSYSVADFRGLHPALASIRRDTLRHDPRYYDDWFKVNARTLYRYYASAGSEGP